MTAQKRKVALISGITGQDGAYLAELLLSKNYIVHGIKRRSSSFNTARVDHLFQERHEVGGNQTFFLHYGDMTDATNLIRLVQDIQPDEIYNLAAQSHVQVSFESPEFTADTNAMGVLRFLEAIRILGLTDKTKFYQASTSELFGKVSTPKQNELTPFYPRSPYAAAKAYAYWITINYREAYGMFAANGILFNHESPIRGETFVTRKITRSVARISRGQQDCLYLGNLEARRDWGHAKDYVEGMWRIMQHHTPDDFVLATGTTQSVRYFAEKAFAEIGSNIIWSGSGPDEIGTDATTGKVLVRVDPTYFRPAEADVLHGDASKAKRILGWHATTPLEDLIREMVQADLAALDSNATTQEDNIQKWRTGSF